ncbi:hypothetical protein P4O66_018573, partial [Electrophorus voltai]
NRVLDGERSASVTMADFRVSLCMLAGIVLISDIARRTTSKLLGRKTYGTYAVELISTVQLCACTHELKLLGEVGRVEQQLALTLTYLISVVHALTFRGALCNPTSTLEHFCRGTLTGRCALTKLACQFVAAVVARSVVHYVWAFGLSDLHLRHKLFGFKCISPINAPLVKAAAVELACAFAVHTTVHHTHGVEEKYRVHAIAAVITTAVYAGMACSILLFGKIIPAFSQKSATGKDQYFSDVKKKMN